MSTAFTQPPRSTIQYPDDDGQPMSDNTLQFKWIVLIKEGLETLFRHEPIYERPVVKRGGADFVSQGSRTSPSPSASVDLAHLRPVRGRFSVHPATHPLSPRPRESFLPQCRQCTKR